MSSFFFGVTPSSHEKSSNPYRKWSLSNRFIFDFLLQKWPKNCIFINKNNWKLVLIITFRNRRMGNFCKKRPPQLHQMFQIQTAKLRNPTRSCTFWKSKKNSPRALLTISYTISTLYTYVAELKSNLHENLVWTRNLHRSSPKLVHFIYRL